MATRKNMSNDDATTALLGLGPLFGRDLKQWLDESKHSISQGARLLKVKVTTLRRLASPKTKDRPLPVTLERKLIDAWSAKGGGPRLDKVAKIRAKIASGGCVTDQKLDATVARVVSEVRKNQNIAVTAIVAKDGFRLAAAVRGEAGYTPFKPDSPNGQLRFSSMEEAQAEADVQNENKGLSKEEATEIVLSTVGQQIDDERDVRVFEVVVRLRVGRFDYEATPESISERLQDAIEINDHVIKVDSIEVTPA